MNKNDIETVSLVTGLQQSMLYKARTEPNHGHYVEQLVFEFERFNEPAMLRAINALISQRRALRSFFIWREQEQARLLTIKKATLSIESLPTNPLEILLQQDREKGIPLDFAPMMRMSVSKTENSHFYCIWSLHHAVVDGWSIVILQDELLKLYKQSLEREPLSVVVDEPKAAIMTSSTRDKRWEKALKNLPRGKTLDSLPGSAANSKKCSELSASLTPDSSAVIYDWCKTQRITFSTFIHCAWSLLLAHISGRDDLFFGSIDSGRSQVVDGESLVGFFMSVKPVRVIIDENQACNKFIETFQRQQWHLGESAPPDPNILARLLDRQQGEALFDSILIVQNYPKSTQHTGIGLLRVIGYEQADAPLMLSVGAAKSIEILFRYQNNYFSTDDVENLLNAFSSMLEVFSEHDGDYNLGSILDNYSLRTAMTMNSVDPALPGRRCIESFVELVDSQPDSIALVDGDHVSYQSLAAIVEVIRRSLMAKGVKRGDVIAIYLPRSTFSVAAMLAIQAVDACYLPLNMSHPRSLLEFMVNDSGTKYVLSNSDVDFSVEVLPIPNQCMNEVLQVSRELTSPDMCMMYTSGSTGEPKGVYISHNAVINRLKWMGSEFPFSNDDVSCNRTPLSFVDSISEIFTPLCAGRPSVIIPFEIVSNLNTLICWLQKYYVNRITLTPSLLDALIEQLNEQNTTLSHLKLCVVSGEELSYAVVNKFMRILPECRLLNLYGSTESTADVMSFELVHGYSSRNSMVPIGKLISGNSGFVANKKDRVLPSGFIGQLIISGISVSRGYHKRSELNARQFNAKGFSTGDLVYIDKNGDTHYRGRSDRQLQVRGQRVEPGAIEALLLRMDGVKDVKVLQCGSMLVAVYVGQKYKAELFIRQISESLQAFFIPQKFVRIGSIPLLSNGKTDYASLIDFINRTEMTIEQSDDSSLFEHQLALTIGTIWQDLLPEVIISSKSHFFDSGGHSILAMRMIAKVERALGFSVDIPLLIENPILSDFAISICNAGSDYTKSEIITLNTSNSGTRAAIYCLHGDGYNLAGAIKREHPLYWISQWAIRLGLSAKPTLLISESIESIASRYVEFIIHVNSNRPIEIIASCGAAVIAVEVAQQLNSLGRLPDRLVLMDLPRGELKAPMHKRLQKRQQESWLKSLYGFAFRRLGGETLKHSKSLENIEQKISIGEVLTDIEARDYTDLLLFSALNKYQPSFYPGLVDLVFSGRWRRGIEDPHNADTPEFWKEFLPNVNAIHFSPANNHEDLLGKEAAAFIADIVNSKTDKGL